MFDKEGNGFITIQGKRRYKHCWFLKTSENILELSEVLRTLGDVLSEEETDEFIAQADLDGDGKSFNLNNVISRVKHFDFYCALIG